jgi:hypothetical protein
MNSQNTNQTGLSKCSIGFGFSLAIACLVNAAIVVIKESSPKVQAWMKSVTGHHWVTHSLIVIVLFVVLGWLFSRGKGLGMGARRLTLLVAGGVVLGSLIIAGFYLFGD